MNAPARKPSRRMIVARPRLLRLLRPAWKVALLSAPAGCGKSALAAQFAEQQQALWCRINPEDTEPFRLLGRLLPLAGALRPRLGARTERLFEQRRDAERDEALISATFIEELGSWPGSLLIVLDDLHHLSASAPSIRWLRRLLEETGPEVRFLITCRGECPLPLSRSALQGGIVRIGEAELAFTPDEQRQLFQKILGSAPAKDAEPLIRSLRGWAAGLVLAARSFEAKGRERPRGLAGSGDSWRANLTAFLFEEIYAPLPARLRRGLRVASLLEDLEAPLLRLLLGARDAEVLLREIQKRDLFTATLPDGSALARFHPLFRDFLRQRLKMESSAEEWRDLHVRLARHWLAGDETSRAARLLAEAEVPENAMGDRTPLLALHAASEAQGEGRLEAAVTLARRAEDAFLANGSHELLARAFRIESTAAIQTGDLEATWRRGRVLWQRIPRTQKVARARLARNLGFLRLHAGRPREALAWQKRALQGFGGAGMAVDRAEARLLRAAVDFTEGRWGSYLREAMAALPILRAGGYERRVRAVYLNMAEACIYRGEEDQALEHLNEAQISLVRNPSVAEAPMAAVQRARAHSEMGRLRESLADFTTARADVEKSGSRQRSLEMALWWGVLDRRAGRLKDAETKLSRAEAGFQQTRSIFWINVARMEWALVRGLRGRSGPALAELRACARVSRKLGDRKELARNRLFEARVIQEAGGSPIAILRASIRILESEDYLILLRKEADVAGPLLRGVQGGGADWHARSMAMLPPASTKRARAPGARPARVQKAAPNQGLQIKLMGAFEVLVGERAATMPRRASQAILAMLALRPGVPVRWEALAERLWPGAGPAQSRNRLDVALRAIRLALEPDVPARGTFRLLRIESGLCHLETARLQTDVAEFERLAQACEPAVRRAALRPWLGAPGESLLVGRSDLREMEAALGAYAGELLPGMESPAWLEDERQRLRARRDRILISQGRLLLALRRPARAMEAAEEALLAEPLRDEAEQLLMRAMAASGRRTDALKSFEAFRALLRRELDAEPDPETAALARELAGA